MSNRAFGVPLSPIEVAAVRIVVRAHGVAEAARRLGVSRGVVERGLGGLGIRLGSVALLRMALTRIAEPVMSGGGAELKVANSAGQSR